MTTSVDIKEQAVPVPVIHVPDQDETPQATPQRPTLKPDPSGRHFSWDQEVTPENEQNKSKKQPEQATKEDTCSDSYSSSASSYSSSSYGSSYYSSSSYSSDEEYEHPNRRRRPPQNSSKKTDPPRHKSREQARQQRREERPSIDIRESVGIVLRKLIFPKSRSKSSRKPSRYRPDDRYHQRHADYRRRQRREANDRDNEKEQGKRDRDPDASYSDPNRQNNRDQLGPGSDGRGKDQQKPSRPPTLQRRPRDQKVMKRASINRLRRQSRLQKDKPASLRSMITLSKLPEAFKDGPHLKKWTRAKFKTQECSSLGGSWSAITHGHTDTVNGKSIGRGIEKFRSYPKLFTAMMYPTEMLRNKWPESQHQYTYIYRDGTKGFQPKNIVKNGKGRVTFLIHTYQPIPSFSSLDFPRRFRDKYTDKMKMNGQLAVTRKYPGLLPGRGLGFLDDPTLKLIGEIEPSDIAQGLIGDCWLLSGIACLAEFDGAVERLFRKTKNFDQMPFADGRPNIYTITLWDLATWKEVDIVIDERLPQRHDGSGTCLGAKPSKDGELWVCYLEKAIAAHCGGYDNLDGGRCTHAWSIMTGRKEQYCVQRDKTDPKKRFSIWAKYNPRTKQWAPHANAPRRGDDIVRRVPWPKAIPGLGVMVGKEGVNSPNLDEDELFLQLCTWEDEDYLIAASTKGTSDREMTNGLVDNHAYSVLDCRDNVAGTGVDLIQVRNPWGRQEIERGTFNRKGPGWQKYPQIKEALEYYDDDIYEDDGVFWLTKEEFFRHFQTIWLGATDMSTFLK